MYSDSEGAGHPASVTGFWMTATPQAQDSTEERGGFTRTHLCPWGWRFSASSVHPAVLRTQLLLTGSLLPGTRLSVLKTPQHQLWVGKAGSGLCRSQAPLP